MPTPTMHFISDLPRSDSTLLSAKLRQPPQVLPLAYQFLGEPWHEGHDFNLETSVESPKSVQPIGAPSKSKKCSTTNQVAQHFLLSLITPMAYSAFWRSTEVSRFNQLDFDAPEFDSALGLSELHKVRPRIALEPRARVLPPDLFQQYQHMSFWQDISNNRQVIATTLSSSASSATPNRRAEALLVSEHQL